LAVQISVRRNLAWMMFSQGGLAVIQFGGSVVMARLLTPYEMGIYAVAAAMIGVLSTIRAFSLGGFLIRESELDPKAVTTTFTINALLAGLTSVMIMGLAGAGGALLGEPGVRRAMMLLAFSPLINIFEFLPITRLERIGAFSLVALAALIRTGLSTLLTIVLAMNSFSYMSIAWGNIAGAAVGVVCTNIIGWRFVSLRVGLQDWKRITAFGLQMLAANASGLITARLSELLLGRLIGISALGLYSRATGLNSMLWDNVHMIIVRISFVDFSEQRRRSISFRDSYLRIVAILTAVLWPAFAGMALLAGPMVATVYGPDWLDAALPLSMLSISGMVLTATTMAGEIFVISGETGLQIRTAIQRQCTGLALFTFGCLGGLGWAAASRIGEAAAAIFYCRSDLNRLTQTHATDYRPIYLQSALLTVGACGPAALLMAASNWSAYTPLSHIFAAIGLGVGVWTIGLWHLRHPLFREMETLSRHLLRLPARTIRS
jgi:O-antigen/teichoic acid export membrane protein